MLRINNQLTCFSTLNAYLLICFARVIRQFNGTFAGDILTGKFLKTVSSGLFLSTMISWNTEPQRNWKSFNTCLNDLSSPSLNFVLEYSNHGLWHSVEITFLPTFNAAFANVEKGITWPLFEGFSSLEGIHFFWVFSLVITIVRQQENEKGNHQLSI